MSNINIPPASFYYYKKHVYSFRGVTAKMLRKNSVDCKFAQKSCNMNAYNKFVAIGQLEEYFKLASE